MFAAASPHAQILLAPWRQRFNGHRLPMIGVTLALLLCAAPTVVVTALRPGQLTLLVGTVTLVLMLQALWLLQFASLQRQNHPNAARLVPGHVQRLREAMFGLWLSITVASALLLGGQFGHGLAWGVAAAATMLLTAVMLRHPLLWTVFWIVPVSERWWGRSAPWRWLRSEGLAMYEQRPLVVSLVALLVLALLLGGLLQGGGRRHAVAYAKGERQRLAMREAARGASTLRYQGHVASALTRLFSAPYRAWMRHLLATARPTPRSVMARVELAFGAGTHWTAQAAAAGFFLGIGLLGLGALAVFGDVEVSQLADSGKFGIAIGLTSFAVNPVMALRNSLYNSRREQALLMLVPGMPRGAALNRQLARRLLTQALSTCLLAVVLVVALTGLDNRVVAYVLAGPPAALLLLRNWASLPAPGGSSMALLILGVMLGGALMYAVVTVLQVPVALLAAGVVGLTAALGLWRWRQLSRYPQALPVGRLG